MSTFRSWVFGLSSVGVNSCQSDASGCAGLGCGAALTELAADRPIGRTGDSDPRLMGLGLPASSGVPDGLVCRLHSAFERGACSSVVVAGGSGSTSPRVEEARLTVDDSRCFLWLTMLVRLRFTALPERLRLLLPPPPPTLLPPMAMTDPVSVRLRGSVVISDGACGSTCVRDRGDDRTSAGFTGDTSGEVVPEPVMLTVSSRCAGSDRSAGSLFITCSGVAGGGVCVLISVFDDALPTDSSRADDVSRDAARDTASMGASRDFLCFPSLFARIALVIFACDDGLYVSFSLSFSFFFSSAFSSMSTRRSAARWIARSASFFASCLTRSDDDGDRSSHAPFGDCCGGLGGLCGGGPFANAAHRGISGTFPPLFLAPSGESFPIEPRRVGGGACDRTPRGLDATPRGPTLSIDSGLGRRAEEASRFVEPPPPPAAPPPPVADDATERSPGVLLRGVRGVRGERGLALPELRGDTSESGGGTARVTSDVAPAAAAGGLPLPPRSGVSGSGDTVRTGCGSDGGGGAEVSGSGLTAMVTTSTKAGSGSGSGCSRAARLVCRGRSLGRHWGPIRDEREGPFELRREPDCRWGKLSVRQGCEGRAHHGAGTAEQGIQAPAAGVHQDADGAGVRHAALAREPGDADELLPVPHRQH
eukprot:Rhum_TRINITY_DN14233_c0_g1::Rhum_TRINITY_DN14233_c0_g1_i1::g.76163::m.76163